MKEETVTDDDAYNESYADTTCNVCFAEFLDTEDLALHIEQMHPSNTKNCQLCPDTYSNLLDYAAHVRDFHFVELRCCDYCWKVFLDERELQRHSMKHTMTNNWFSCSQCEYMFEKPAHLRFHEEKYHNNNYDGVYLLCMPHLASILNLKIIPLLQTEGKNEFECMVCEYNTTDFAAYKKHLQKLKCQGSIACNRCSGVFKQKKNIIKHLTRTQICTSIDKYADEPFQCCDCKKMVHPAILKHHLKTDCNRFYCNQCTVVCESITELSNHQMSSHPVDLDILRCKFCHKEFISNLPLKKHIERVHKPDFPLYKYKCITCDAIFKHPQKLFAHFYTQHKELEPFTCKICDKKFRVRKGFTLHIKLDHKSDGFVEFDDRYHVFFTEHKSEKPFIPKCVLPDEDFGQFENNEEDHNTTAVRTAQILDTDATEAESEEERKVVKKIVPLKRKMQLKQIRSKQSKKSAKQSVAIYSSDDEPLLEIRKRVKKVRKDRKTHNKWNWKKKNSKMLYACNICKINCYTYQNHQNHMNLHNKKQQIKCVKCSETFKTTADLTDHMNTDHATSRLTETLKNLLKKKQVTRSTPKTPEKNEKYSKTKNTKFAIAMKKVKCERSTFPAKITVVSKELSAKNFIENFTPEVTEPKQLIKIDSSVSIKKCSRPYPSEPIIKMTRFKNQPLNNSVSLRMPQKFKAEESVRTKISIKLVQQHIPKESNFILPDISYADNFQDNDHNDNDNNDNHFYNDDEKIVIPEMAHEVSLEGTEEPPPNIQVPTKIILPKLPKGYSKIHVATLQPKAPFFKIIKIDSEKGTVTDKTLPVEKNIPPKNDIITLPSGGKLVTANPLAHLLKKPVEEIMEEKYKYYKPANRDFKGMLASAMQKLVDGPPPKKQAAKKTERIKKAKPPAKDYKGMLKNAMKKLGEPPAKKIKAIGEENVEETETDVEENEQYLEETEKDDGENEQYLEETEKDDGENEQYLEVTEKDVGENEQFLEETEKDDGENEQYLEETETYVAETENSNIEVS